MSASRVPPRSRGNRAIARSKIGAEVGGRSSRLGIGDRALAVFGFLAAFSSALFAGLMLTRREPVALVYGAEHLQIFARPKTNLAEARAQHDAVSTAGTDTTPVGAIPGAGRGQEPTLASAIGGYRLVSANRQFAWVESQGGFRQVRKGDVLSGLGRVNALENIDGRWRLRTETGVVLFADANGGDPKASRSEPPLSRSLIFREDGE